MSKALKFPYGNSDFYQVRNEGYFFVDRSDRLPLLEEIGKQLLFLRPRRFGKSLWLSLLEHYYDLARADEFERLFGDLAIGANPTPLRNQYFVLKWDFSNVEATGDAESIKRALYTHINDRIEDFAVYYQAHLPRPIAINPENALSSLQSLLRAVRQTPHKLYLLIDEYDNFANEVLMASGEVASSGPGRQRYEELVKGEGIFKTVFKAIKSASQGLGLERVFITGVSPVVMADLSSGYNVAEDIYFLPEFHDLCGFGEMEVAGALAQVAVGCQFTPAQVDEYMYMIRTFYNGYRFHSEATALIYNPTLVLYFLKALQRYCKPPEEMLDSNLAMDRNRIIFLSQLQSAFTVGGASAFTVGGASAFTVGGASAEPLVERALSQTPPLTTASLAHRFGVAEMFEDEKRFEFILALLYYLGVLTMGGRDEKGQLLLAIPNLVIRKLYAERLNELLLPGGRSQELGQTVAKALYQQGEIQPLCDFVEQKLLRVLDNRDYLHANELTIKTAFLSLLFEDHFYIVDSEPELDRGYGDLSLIIRPDMRQYKLLDILLEFKYLKLGEIGVKTEELRQMSVDGLKALDSVKGKLGEAQTQLQQYRQTLTRKYGAALRLRTFAVVALGFERLVWQEVTANEAEH